MFCILTFVVNEVVTLDAFSIDEADLNNVGGGHVDWRLTLLPAAHSDAACSLPLLENINSHTLHTCHAALKLLICTVPSSLVVLLVSGTGWDGIYRCYQTDLMKTKISFCLMLSM